MWILINNRPVCVFDIKNVTVIMKLTPEVFYEDNRVRGGCVIGELSVLFKMLINCIVRKWNVHCH